MAAPSLTPPATAKRADSALSNAVPASWRLKQGVLLALLALLAAWFFVTGYQSPPGDSGAADNRSIADLIGFGVIGALVWLTTPATWTVATTAFHEAIRKRWVTAMLAFAIVMLALSTFFTWMAPGAEQKFLRDFGLGFTVIMTVIAAIFLGVAMIPPEIERRTIFTILSKPINRLEYLLGKYIGLMMTLTLNLLVMGAIFLAAYAFFVISREGMERAFLADGLGVSRMGLWFDLGNLTRALAAHWGVLAIMAALAMMLSQFLTGITAIVISFVVYFLGQSWPYWERLAGGSGEGTPALGPTARALIEGTYFFLPRLDRFEVRERMVSDLVIGANYLIKAGASAAIYAAVLLAIAYFAWSDREF